MAWIWIGAVASAQEAAPTFAPANTYEHSVVMISAVQQEYEYAAPWKKQSMIRGTGSGFIIDGRRILTNAHNVANQRYLEVTKQNLARRWPARVLFVGHDCDLALLAIDDPAFFEGTVPLELGPLPAVNSTVQTCGFPVGGRTVSITEGVVSRIEVGIYSHSKADSHLLVQTDAAINPGNSGGPVLQNGKVVGVAFQGLQLADNIGYMIPTTVIRHFLTDVEDGTYDGFGSLGIVSYDGLHSPAYTAWLDVPPAVEGLVVLDTIINSTVEDVLQPGDVITEIDGYSIDNDGMIRIHGLHLELSEAVEQKQIGDEIRLAFYRGGEKHSATVKVHYNEPVLTWRQLHDLQPEYKVYAGLVFVSLNRNYLETWGQNWVFDIPFYLRYLFYDVRNLNQDRLREEYVVLADILPDPVNAYAGGFIDQVVESINAVPIRSLKDLDAGLTRDEDGFLVIRFLGNQTPLILDAAKAAESHPQILEKYSVPAESHLENKQ